MQAIYQILVMIFLMYFGGLVFFEESFNLVSTPLRDIKTLKATDRLVLDTICFHTFILMNLFNQINCRIVDDTEWNVFGTLLNNPMFWVILGLEVLVQQVMIDVGASKLGSALLGTAELTFGMQVTCWCLGAFSLVVGIIVKKTVPVKAFDWMVKVIDLEQPAEDDKVHKAK